MSKTISIYLKSVQMKNLYQLIVLFYYLFICDIYVNSVKATEVSDNDYELWSIGSNNLSIPHKMIHFSWRRLVAIPFHSKRHIAKIKVTIQTGSDRYIENINLFRCIKYTDHNNDDNSHEIEWISKRIIIDNSEQKHMCLNLLAFWSSDDELNKTVLSLPESIGIPIGDYNENYLLFEINYKNSDLIHGLRDSSGFVVFVDKHYRELDADIVAVGSAPDYRFFIPPKLKEWTVTGNCLKECLKNKLNSEEINILNVLYYGRHELLEDMNIQISKRDEESKVLLNSLNEIIESHDSQELKIANNDKITISCKFNSIHRNKTTLGGFARESSQCIAWLLYYPKIDDFNACLSSFSLSTIMSVTGIEQLEEHWRTENNFDILIKYPNTNQIERLEDYLLRKSDWDLKRLNRAKYAAQFGRQIAQCDWKRSILDEM